jgi:uncharacterized membrane protein
MLKSFAAATVTALALDAFWLTFRAAYHVKLMKSVQGSDPVIRVIPALLIYILIPAAVVYFAVNPASSLKEAVLSGLFLGFTIYGVYDLTNLASLKAWTLEMTFTDMAWGTLLCGAAAAAGYYVKK